MHLERIDTAGRLYVLREGKGFSCYGFDVLDRKARAVAEWMKDLQNNPHATLAARAWLDAIGKEAIGTEDHFVVCSNILDRAQIHCSVFGDRCPAELVPALVGLEGRRVEATYFGERIRFKVGKSTGWLPAHLRLANKRSHCGEAILAEHITDVRAL